jgi:hypothetical protein
VPRAARAPLRRRGVGANSGEPHLLDLSSAEPETIARSYLCGEGRAGGSWTGRVEASRALRTEGWHVSALALGRTSHEPVSGVGRTEPRRSLASSLVNSPRSDVLPQLFLTYRGLGLRCCRGVPGHAVSCVPVHDLLASGAPRSAPPRLSAHAEVPRGPTTRGALVRPAIRSGSPRVAGRALRPSDRLTFVRLTSSWRSGRVNSPLQALGTA